MIGIGDLLKISVLGAQDYDQDVRVAGSGDIVIGLVGRVHVAGQTTEQAQALIRKRLMDGGYFADPQVAVFEKEFATQGVSVLGEVQKPGVYPVTGPRRLFDVLSLAGGTTPKAGQVVTVSSRDNIKPLRSVTFSSDPKKNEPDEPDEPEQSEASGSRRIALNCDGIEVKTMVLLRYGFRAVGEVRFVGAKIASLALRSLHGY